MLNLHLYLQIEQGHYPIHEQPLHQFCYPFLVTSTACQQYNNQCIYIHYSQTQYCPRPSQKMANPKSYSRIKLIASHYHVFRQQHHLLQDNFLPLAFLAGFLQIFVYIEIHLALIFIYRYLTILIILVLNHSSNFFRVLQRY